MTQLFIKDVINYIEMKSLSKQDFGCIRCVSYTIHSSSETMIETIPAIGYFRL